MNNHLIEGPDALRAFRKWWDGVRILNLVLESEVPVLINWAVGVGKSCNLDNAIEAAVQSGRFDLVVVLLPQREVQRERRWVRHPPPDITVVDLKPRPSELCGPQLNKQWAVLEVRGLGALARRDLCTQCKNKRTCFWLRQYGKALQGAKVIFANQKHLELDARFIARLKGWAGAETVLVLMDEASFVTKNRKIIIEHEELERYCQVLDSLEGQNPALGGNVHNLNLLMMANTSDLRRPTWSFRRLSLKQSFKLQELGYKQFGGKFSNIESELDLFCHSDLKRREKTGSGAVSFPISPDLGAHMMIYSGTIVPEFLEYRLGMQVANPFEDHVFSHPDTLWYNINSYIGTRRHFLGRSPQVLDFFAALTARRLAEGKRVLLICKKVFVNRCAEGMEQALARLGLSGMRVVVGDWREVDLDNPKIIPLINYGIIGINLFQEFHCAYCLTGYYVDQDAVNNILQDSLASDQEIPIEIGFEGNPKRRVARAANYKDRYTNVNELAPMALREQELNAVMQAVGRVRPYTKPREVITFQCDVIPEVPEEHVFLSLGEARAHFEIKTRKEAQRLKTQELVQKAKRMGLTQQQAAEKIGRGLRTVQRYW